MKKNNYMKNIYLLPTDRPSKLQLQMNGKYHLENGETIALKSYYNIYITSDEEIKEEDINTNFCIFKSDNGMITCLSGKGNGRVKTIGKYYKIILTTDTDLIADGVQAIDDEFLEWFVKNPSCELVEVIYGLYNTMGRKLDLNDLHQNQSQAVWKYKIIIPKEEQKQHLIDLIQLDEESGLYKETLKEAAEKLYKKSLKNDNHLTFYDGVQFGAKWQEEKMYSEKEVLKILYEWSMYKIEIELEKLADELPNIITYKEWFEQFKKK